MTKEITLTISERVALSKILNTFKGDLTSLSLLLDDIKKVAINPEEWKKAELVKTPVTDEKGNPTGQENWNWKDEKETDKKIEFASETIQFVKDEIKKKEDAKEITLADISLISLKAKL